jgi:mycothiol synthase
VNVLSWLDELDQATVEQVHALLAAATEADGTEPVGEQVVTGLRGRGPHLVARAEHVVGYAQLARDGDADVITAELAVHPAARRHGVGTELVRALLSRAGSDPGGGGQLRVWAHGEHPGALRLADTFGFRRARELWQMRRSLHTPQLPAVSLPAGVRLRSFVVGQDEAEFLRVNNAAFDWHPEQGGWGVEQITEREAQPWFDPAGFLLAFPDGDSGEPGGPLLGFHWTKVHTSPEHIGEVYVLGVDPAAQGRRLGAALTLAGLHYLRGRGLDDVLLYVEADNHAAVRVYEKLGFTRWHTDTSFARP